jgi:Tfp pilus assembly protein PilE
MVKNNKGITLISLAVTIAVLSILITISINSGYSSIKKVRAGRLVSYMTMVRAKSKLIYEDYQFKNTSLVGTKSDLPEISENEKSMIMNKYDISSDEFEKLNWYKWEKKDLKDQGFDENMLDGEECYYINYEYGEIISSESVENFYSLTGLNKIYEQS